MVTNFSRRQALVTSAAALLVSACQESSRSNDSDLIVDRLFTHQNELMRSIVEKHLAAGVAFGVGHHSGNVRLGSYGFANIESSLRVGNTTSFRIASITKTFVAVSIMRLIEKGALTLDTPLIKFFPKYPLGGAVTIRQLLSHTSGLKDWWETSLPKETPGNFLFEAEPHQYLQLASDPYNFPPGTDHWYSNTAYVLLGEIVEIVSGENLSNYLKKLITEPLGLKSTIFEMPGESSERWALGYHLNPDLNPPFIKSDFDGLPGAAGAMRSSIADLLKWSSALFSNTILHQDTITQMTKMGSMDDGRPISASTWKPSWMTDISQPSSYMEDIGWGLGFSLFKVENKSVVWHSGGIPGFNAIWLNVPEKSLSIVMLANTDNGAISAFDAIVPAMVN